MTFERASLNNQRRIGLTGGIASGKTTIAKYISSKKNIKILDADNYSRKCIQSGTESYQKIVSYFGQEIIDKKSKEKEINRNLLKEIIFNDATKRLWIENLLHPLIKEKMKNDCLINKKEKILLLVIPLLFEANFTDLCTEIWIVSCPSHVQIERLIKRDKITEKAAKQIINIQSLYIENEKKSDVILDNHSKQIFWKNKIDKLI